MTLYLYNNWRQKQSAVTHILFHLYVTLNSFHTKNTLTLRTFKSNWRGRVAYPDKSPIRWDFSTPNAKTNHFLAFPPPDKEWPQISLSSASQSIHSSSSQPSQEPASYTAQQSSARASSHTERATLPTAGISTPWYCSVAPSPSFIGILQVVQCSFSSVR